MQEIASRLGVIVVSGVAFLAVHPPDAPGQTIRFADVTERAGVNTDGPAQGVAVADVDGDGRDDIFFAGAAGSSTLLINQGDATFHDATGESGLDVPGNAVAPVWADFNNDGALDLFVGIRSGSEPNRLFKNNGDGTFTDVATITGVDSEARIGSATFGDYDRDGYLDLFLATRGGTDQLYRNINGASFQDVTMQAGVEGQTASVAMQATWVDYDRDGDLDLFAVHDGVTVNRLYRNDGVLPFTEIAASVGIDVVGSGNGMGVTWFDSDMDGRDDVYVTRIGVASLYRNREDGRFEDMAVEMGVEKNGMSWGVVSEDLDNDGDEDLFVVNTHTFDNVSETWVYRNDGGSFTNVARSAGAALKLDSFGVAAGDFNSDGLVDLILTSVAGDNRLLLNVTEDPGNWLDVELDNGPLNTFAAGASVRVVTQSGKQFRSMRTADGYCSQSMARLHFGLASETVVDTLDVMWPDGTSDRYLGLQGNKGYVLRKGMLSVSSEERDATPSEISITAVYPNPFHDRTRISFSLDRTEHVVVDVVDLMGRTLSTVSSGVLGAGRHQAFWSGQASGQGTVASGVYLIRLRVSDRQVVRAVIRAD